MLDAYFTPIPEALYSDAYINKHLIGGHLKVHYKSFPKIGNAQVAIIGVGEQANRTREEFYQLTWRFDQLKVVDLGNFKEPNDPQQRHFAVSEAIGELLSLNIIVIILSDDKSHLKSHFHGFRDSKTPLEVSMVSPGIQLEPGSECLELLQDPAHTKNLSNIDFMGTQAYYISQHTAEQLERYNFENYRLGNLRNDIEEAEPILRSSEMLFFDISSVRLSDAPESCKPTPNGLYAEEAAKICRYAGLSNKLQSATFYGLNTNRTSSSSDILVAQLIWYFLDGINSRYNDHPTKNDSNYLIYRNRLENTGHEITFYKSRKSDRWWMEVPHPFDDETFFIGCSYKDYQQVCNGEMPDRWWRAYQRYLK